MKGGAEVQKTLLNMRVQHFFLWAWLLFAPMAYAGGGLFGIDHELPLDQNGIWARSWQTGIEYGAIAVEVAEMPHVTRGLDLSLNGIGDDAPDRAFQ